MECTLSDLTISVTWQGELDSAEKEVRFVLAHDEYNINAEYILGGILELKGLLKQARHYFLDVLKKDHLHKGAITALQRIAKKVK